ncbi:uncharacterized protein PRCAT00002442001 [Priceomyces carsonii]|uniref:uncharacterized protein n=1 Tax=Priceomyces carsonii TaxID=28549 RepID=UPI002EDA3853|nr:unnamed protein product [Priceomyces carsonii]
MKYCVCSLIYLTILFASWSVAGEMLKVGFRVKRGDTIGDMSESTDEEVFVKRAKDEVTAELQNKRTFYLAEIKIGSKKEKLSALLDTGSSDLWVMGHNIKCQTILKIYKRMHNDFEGNGVVEREEQQNEYDDTSDSDIYSSYNYPYESYFYGSYYESLTGEISGLSKALLSAIQPPTTTYSHEIGYSTKYTSASTCTSFGSFNTANSDTYKRNNSAPDFSITYADYSNADGVWGSDDVEIGGQSLKSLVFAVANRTTSHISVLGIGLPQLEITNSYLNGLDAYEYENLPMKLKSQGLINKVAYSLYLADAESKNGTVLFGAVDHAKYTGPLETVPIISTYSYEEDLSRITIMLTSMTFDSGKEKTNINGGYRALLDSGSTLTYFPPTLLYQIGSMLNGIWDLSMVTYRVNCTHDSNVAFVFNFSGKTIRVPLSNLLIRSLEDYCYLGIIESSEYLIFGDNFLRSAYIVYDLEDEEVSLAQAKYTDDEDIEIITSSIPGVTRAAKYNSTTMRYQTYELLPVVSYLTGVLTGSGWSPFTSADGGSGSGSKGNGALQESPSSLRIIVLFTLLISFFTFTWL